MKLILPKKENMVVSEKFDISWIYAGKSSRAAGHVYTKRLELIASLVRKEKYSKIVELGSGSGILLPSLSKVGDLIVAMDIKRNFSDLKGLCKKEGIKNVLFVRADIEHLPFKENAFDLALTVSILEHIKNLEDTLKGIKKIVSSEGNFVAGYPIEKFATNLAFKISGMKKIVDVEHVSNFQKIRDLIKKTFTVVEKRKYPASFLPDNFSFYEGMLCNTHN